MIDNNIFIFYLYSDNIPKACFAFERLNNGNYKIAMSHCSNKDRFCKKIGRNIAIGRLTKAEELSITKIDEMIKSDTIKNLVDHCIYLGNINHLNSQEDRIIKFWSKIRNTKYRI